jgi:hypothetical protein
MRGFSLLISAFVYVHFSGLYSSVLASCFLYVASFSPHPTLIPISLRFLSPSPSISPSHQRAAHLPVAAVQEGGGYVCDRVCESLLHALSCLSRNANKYMNFAYSIWDGSPVRTSRFFHRAWLGRDECGSGCSLVVSNVCWNKR